MKRKKVCGRIYSLTALDSAETKTAKSPMSAGLAVAGAIRSSLSCGNTKAAEFVSIYIEMIAPPNHTRALSLLLVFQHLAGISLAQCTEIGNLRKTYLSQSST